MSKIKSLNVSLSKGYETRYIFKKKKMGLKKTAINIVKIKKTKPLHYELNIENHNHIMNKHKFLLNKYNGIIMDIILDVKSDELIIHYNKKYKVTEDKRDQLSLIGW